MPKKKKQPANKFNSKKVERHGIKFDSVMEADYYDYLKRRQPIDGFLFEMQKTFTLLDGFEVEGEKVRPITYKADFVLHFPDGSKLVIDVKGHETADFKLKKKLFEARYDQRLTLVTRAPKYLAPIEWVTLEELKAVRKARKEAQQ